MKERKRGPFYETPCIAAAADSQDAGVFTTKKSAERLKLNVLYTTSCVSLTHVNMPSLQTLLLC